MNIYIRVKDGKPFEHPILEENFREVFPDVDVTNLPPEFATFTRVPPPPVGSYEVYEGLIYEPYGSGYTDIHHVRPMTEEEKLAKQEKVKADWAEHGYPSWIFDEETCAFKAPEPPPDYEKPYRWDEETISWIEVVNV